MKQFTVFVFIVSLCLMFLGNVQPVAAQENPPIPSAPQGTFILDQLDWLTPAQEAEMDGITKKLDREGIAQISIVTLNDCGTDKKKFRYELFNTWGIGHANDNDGLLILVCWYGGDKERRSVEQEVGYGLENTLTSTLTDNVVKEYFIPAFQHDQPGNGLVQMVSEYDYLLRTLSLPTESVHPVKNQQKPDSQWNIFSNPEKNIYGILSLVAVLFLLTMIVIHGWKLWAKRSAHPSKREKQREAEELRSLIFLWVTAIILTFSAVLGFIFHPILGMVVGVLIELLLVATWQRGRGQLPGQTKKAGTISNAYWFSGDSYTGGIDSSSGGGFDGGGFGGGDSGGAGSSSDF